MTAVESECCAELVSLILLVSALIEVFIHQLAIYHLLPDMLDSLHILMEARVCHVGLQDAGTPSARRRSVMLVK